MVNGIDVTTLPTEAVPLATVINDRRGSGKVSSSLSSLEFRSSLGGLVNGFRKAHRLWLNFAPFSTTKLVYLV